jgi:hypothetical protein
MGWFRKAEGQSPPKEPALPKIKQERNGRGSLLGIAHAQPTPLYFDLLSATIFLTWRSVTYKQKILFKRTNRCMTKLYKIQFRGGL